MSPTDSGDQALIDSWVNEAVLQFLRDTKMVVRTASLNFTANVGDYTLDDDVLSFIDAWVDPDVGQSTFLQQISNADLLRMRLLTENAAPPTMYYSLDGTDILRFYPTPHTSDDTMHILYVPRPTLSLSSSSHTPSNTAYGGIPSEYHPTLEAYAKWKAAESEEHGPSQSGVTFMTMYEDGVRKAIATKNRKAGVMKGRARVGAPSNRFPFTPGTDFGV